MKQKFDLDQKDIERAIKEMVEREKSVTIKTVVVRYHTVTTSDPRESSYVYATASE